MLARVLEKKKIKDNATLLRFLFQSTGRVRLHYNPVVPPPENGYTRAHRINNERVHAVCSPRGERDDLTDTMK